MADTFFGFNAALDNGDHLLPPDDDDCVENEEEEYDALNDETFGDLEDNSTLDDWEQQHEQYAKNVEKTKCPEYDSISDSLQQCRDNLIKEIDQWSINIINSSTFQATLEEVTKSFIETRLDGGGGSSGNRSNNDLSSTNRTTASATVPKTVNQLASIPLSPIHHHHHQQQQQQHIPKQICTVEELEKNLIKNAKSPLVKQQYPQQHQHQGPNLFQLPPQRLPPGLPIGMPPQVRHLPPPPHIQPPPPPHHHHHHHPPLPPPGMLQQQHHHHHPHHPPPHPMMPPHFMQTGPPPPPRLLYPHMNYNFPQPQPPPPHLQQQQQRNLQQLRQQPPHLPPQQLLQQQQLQQQQQQQQRVKNDNRRQNEQQNHNNNNNNDYDKDEYAGLMTNREKQWLLNIQLLQLNTGTPYFDDYYYTVFKERKAKSAANNHNNINNNNNNSNENNNGNHNNNHHHHNNNNNNNNRENLLNDNRRYQNNRQRTNDNRQDNSTTNTTLTPRIYTPLQFENSLGKLQCGSVTAPRKIIDMDIVTPDKDNDNNNTSTQQQQLQRKTKQLLLELEVLFTLLLKAEDLRNPLAIINMEKLREIKQKQRLRELELAPTAEQKQEILKLFKQESELKQENPQDYIVKILQLLLNNDEQKFASYLNIRKGKQLLIRLLPHLYYDNFQQQLFDIWHKLLLCIPIIGRRDTIGDQLLPKLHPFFKRFIHSCTIHDILEIANSLTEIVNKPQDSSSNSRCTPLSHQGGRPPLYFVLLNKFGVSALVTLFIRTEYLLSTDQVIKKQQLEWLNFLINWSDQINYVINKIAVPIEPIPLQIFIKHCNRFNNNNNKDDDDGDDDNGGDNLTIDKKSLLEKYFVDTV